MTAPSPHRCRRRTGDRARLTALLAAETARFVFLRSRKDRLRVIELFAAKHVRLVADRGPSYGFSSADRAMIGCASPVVASPRFVRPCVTGNVPR